MTIKELLEKLDPEIKLVYVDYLYKDTEDLIVRKKDYTSYSDDLDVNSKIQSIYSYVVFECSPSERIEKCVHITI